MSERVLVTGATSLLGAGVVDALTRRGDTVVAFQRRALERRSTSVHDVRGDIRDLAALVAASESCTAVIHLAAKVGVVGDWESFRSVNVDGTHNVLTAARRSGLSKAVHISSPSVAHQGAAIVGGGAEPPFVGRNGAWYPESKALAESIALDATTGELGVVVLRPHLIWGPGDTQLVGRIIERARTGRIGLVNHGNALIDTTYIDNAVMAVIAALDAVSPGAPCSGRAYVIANGEPRPIRELVEGFCAAAGLAPALRSLPLRVAAPAGSLIEALWRAVKPGVEPPLTRFVAEQLGTAHWFDPRPAATDLGYRPSVTIDEGLERLARWFASEQTMR